MRVETIWISNTKNGDRRKVNLSDWASDLGRGQYSGWTAITDALNVGVDKESPAPVQTTHEVGKVVETETQSETVEDRLELQPDPPRRKPGRPRGTAK